jgi:hypothetical protein
MRISIIDDQRIRIFMNRPNQRAIDSQFIFSPDAKALAELTALTYRIVKWFLPSALIPISLLMGLLTWEVSSLGSAEFVDVPKDISWGPSEYAVMYQKRGVELDTNVNVLGGTYSIDHGLLRLDGVPVENVPIEPTPENEFQDTAYLSHRTPLNKEGRIVRVDKSDSFGDFIQTGTNAIGTSYENVLGIPDSLPQTITLAQTPDVKAKAITLAFTKNNLTIAEDNATPTTIATLNTTSWMGLKPQSSLIAQTSDGRYLIINMNTGVYLIDAVAKKIGPIGEGNSFRVTAFRSNGSSTATSKKNPH